MSDTFCPHPWVGLSIAPTGVLNPCCKFQQEGSHRARISESSISSYKNSQWLKELKRQLLAGEKPKGCSRCWAEESAGVKSMRQQGIEQYGTTTDDNFLVMNIALGNLCNLKCRICNARSSTSWIKEYKQFTGVDVEVQDWHLSEIHQVLPFLTTVTKIEFPGGEPMLLEQEAHYTILERLVSLGRANEVVVHYNTNGTRIPQQQRWELLKEFKEVSIQLSIDDTGKRFEYNRHPAHWDQVYQNIKHYQCLAAVMPNLKISIAYTVSVFTIAYAAEFHQWAKSEGIDDVWYSRLESPAYYQCSLFNEQGRNEIASKLQASPATAGLAEYLFEPHPGLEVLRTFWWWTKRLDQTRSQNFQQTFPEILAYLKP